jgi:hypothetical protein
MQEMLRKLLLSVVGAFWAQKSTTCVATALIFSATFQVLHTAYWPFKSQGCNQLQQICLSVLNIVYIAGLLLKTKSLEAGDQEDLGILLVLLLIVATVAVVLGVVFEIRELLRSVTRTRKLAFVLRGLPQQDPPNDTSEFYDVQIPVAESNMGAAFEPKSPFALAGLSTKSKLAVVQILTTENEQRLERFFYKLSTDRYIPVQQVKSSTQVVRNGLVCAKSSRKTEESIVAKACRPAILANNPLYSIEHVRDTFRFKCVVFSFRDAIEFILAMHNDRTSPEHSLCPNPNGGLSPRNVAKFDMAKLQTPKEWGWRFLAFDFIMPNHQIVECYIVFSEMEAAKKTDDSTAVVCAELSNHEIFEKWRIVDTAGLVGERLAEYDRDRTESNRRYNEAFKAVLSHTSALERQEFWKILAMKPSGGEVESDGSGQEEEGYHTNPVADELEGKKSFGQNTGFVRNFAHFARTSMFGTQQACSTKGPSGAFQIQTIYEGGGGGGDEGAGVAYVTNPMGDELSDPPVDPSQGIDLAAGTHFDGKRKGSMFGDTNPMKGIQMANQLAVGMDEKMEQEDMI